MGDTAIEAKNDATTNDYYSFRFRSTGLGEQMLMGEPLKFLVVDDMLVMQVQTTEPVQWVIRAGFTYRGLLRALKLALNPAVIKFLLFGWKSIKSPKLTSNF